VAIVQNDHLKYVLVTDTQQSRKLVQM